LVLPDYYSVLNEYGMMHSIIINFVSGFILVMSSYVVYHHPEKRRICAVVVLGFSMAEVLSGAIGGAYHFTPYIRDVGVVNIFAGIIGVFGGAFSIMWKQPSTRTIKTQDRCPNCGAILREKARFCPNCGTSLSETAIYT